MKFHMPRPQQYHMMPLDPYASAAYPWNRVRLSDRTTPVSPPSPTCGT